MKSIRIHNHIYGAYIEMTRKRRFRNQRIITCKDRERKREIRVYIFLNIFAQWHIQVTYFLNNVIFCWCEAVKMSQKEKRTRKKRTEDTRIALTRRCCSNLKLCRTNSIWNSIALHQIMFREEKKKRDKEEKEENPWTVFRRNNCYVHSVKLEAALQ